MNFCKTLYQPYYCAPPTKETIIETPTRPICTFAPVISETGEVTWDDGRSYKLKVVDIDDTPIFETGTAVISPYQLPLLIDTNDLELRIDDEDYTDCGATSIPMLQYPCPDQENELAILHKNDNSLYLIHSEGYAYKLYNSSNDLVASGVLNGTGDTLIYNELENDEDYVLELVNCDFSILYSNTCTTEDPSIGYNGNNEVCYTFTTSSVNTLEGYYFTKKDDIIAVSPFEISQANEFKLCVESDATYTVIIPGCNDYIIETGYCPGDLKLLFDQNTNTFSLAWENSLTHDITYTLYNPSNFVIDNGVISEGSTGPVEIFNGFVTPGTYYAIINKGCVVTVTVTI